MFKKERYDLSRFWELFSPTTNNFQFWLASSAFSFFAYTSLLPKNEANMSFHDVMREIVANTFLVFGWLCMLILIYLLISWIFGFRIDVSHKKRKPKNGDAENGKNNRK